MMTHLLFLLAMLVSTSARLPPNSAALHRRRRAYRFDVGGLRCRVLAHRGNSAAVRRLSGDAGAKVRSEGARRTSLRAILADLRNCAELMTREDVLVRGSTMPLVDERDGPRGFGGRGSLGIRLVRARGGQHDAARALTSTIVLLGRASRGQSGIRVRRQLFAVVAGVGNVRSAPGRDGVVVTGRAPRARQGVRSAR